MRRRQRIRFYREQLDKVQDPAVIQWITTVIAELEAGIPAPKATGTGR